MISIENVPTQKQASILLGNIAIQLIRKYGIRSYDYSLFVCNDADEIDAKKTIKKLSRHLHVLPEESVVAIGAISMYLAKNEEVKYPFDVCQFTFGLMDGETDWSNN